MKAAKNCIWLVLALAIVAGAQQEDAATLFHQLQSPDTKEQATQALLARGATDRQTRQLLVNELPPVIDGGWKNSQAWDAAVRLAGGLRIAEAAPGLTKWVGLDETGPFTSTSLQDLDNDPAAKALAQIGEPAIPAIAAALQSEPPQQRIRLYFTLEQINSPKAEALLRERLPVDTDPECHYTLEHHVPRKPAAVE